MGVEDEVLTVEEEEEEEDEEEGSSEVDDDDDDDDDEEEEEEEEEEVETEGTEGGSQWMLPPASLNASGIKVEKAREDWEDEGEAEEAEEGLGWMWTPCHLIHWGVANLAVFVLSDDLCTIMSARLFASVPMMAACCLLLSRCSNTTWRAGSVPPGETTSLSKQSIDRKSGHRPR